MQKETNILLQQLKDVIAGDVFIDDIHKTLYATDASAYREKPIGVVRPKDKNDIAKIISFANTHNIPLIPRTAGTSLAGQVVGNGLIVDVSKYMTAIIQLNTKEKWVRVEPGVVLDELNIFLSEHNLFFGPETSTSNRCMMGGMVGNNSCGAHSLIYGSTREHTIELSGFLSNGEYVKFSPLSTDEYLEKCKQTNKEGNIYQTINSILSNPDNVNEIKKEFPHPEIKRRNTGYAIDILLDNQPFNPTGAPFNMCRLIAGSEGTLFLITEIKLSLVDSPPKEKAVVCVHFHSLEEAYQGNLIALNYNPGAVELMDKTVMDLAKENISQNRNRFFIEGDPKALLLIEFARHSRTELNETIQQMITQFKQHKKGYSHPIVYGNDIKRIWALRKAGLGILANIPGDAKPAPVIEDTAVRPVDLPQYIAEFNSILKSYNKECVYYAHIGTGELHLRPILNLKDPEDVKNFHDIAKDTAHLVKKYKGSLSGEHGDGRLRGAFIPLMIGEKNYQLIKDIKNVFDEKGLLNPNKIVETPPMNQSLRFDNSQNEQKFIPIFDWSSTQGLIRAAEKCNGSGDCRKSEIIGGTMCPSYMGSRDERNTTRARANILREFLNNSTNSNPFDHKEIYEILDLCLSCKACKSECPSNVDMAKLKAEFLHHYYKANGTPTRTKIIGYTPRINQLITPFYWAYNFVINSKTLSSLVKKQVGFAPKRSLPELSKQTLKNWYKRKQNKKSDKRIYLFADEFTNFNESEIGIKTILLLEHLGYEVIIPKHVESGRTFLSKGLLKQATRVAEKNIDLLSPLISKETPLIGIEPSAILTFRDEYTELGCEQSREKAKKIAPHCMLLDEFLDKEIQADNIQQDAFTTNVKHIKFHAHCYQKALSNTQCTQRVLSFPKNYSAEEIPSGCCGMAGSFGFEKEHYELSQKIGELVLLPEVRKSSSSILISAAGTSCRHQIKDGTSRKALHTAEILFDALA